MSCLGAVVVTGSMYWVGLAGGRVISRKVDARETTLLFWQEIYDDQGNLVELHEKYPVDRGRQKV